MTVVKRVLARTVLAISFIALLVPLFIATYVNFTQDAWPTWSGFGVNRGPILQSNEQFQREKTYWDLLQLLVIPLGLAVGGYLLNQSARRSELQIAEQNSQESALKSYLDYIKELLLDKSLREDSEAQALATAQTRTVLRTLNGERRGHVLQFLHDARLIQKNNPLINLEDANLQSAKLQRADLHGAC